MNFRLKAKIEDNKLIWFNPERFQELLKSMSGGIEVVFRKVKSPRTNQQNRYYWGVIIKILSEELGYDPQDLHYALRSRFLATIEDQGTAGGLTIPKSTTSLSTKEFEAYMEEIRRWSAGFLATTIPEPNEVELEEAI